MIGVSKSSISNSLGQTSFICGFHIAVSVPDVGVPPSWSTGGLGLDVPPTPLLSPPLVLFFVPFLLLPIGVRHQRRLTRRLWYESLHA